MMFIIKLLIWCQTRGELKSMSELVSKCPSIKAVSFVCKAIVTYYDQLSVGIRFAI